MSGRPGSNRRPTAWKAVALPTELLPLINDSYSLKIARRYDFLLDISIIIKLSSGGGRNRTYSAKSNGFTVRPGSPTPAHPPMIYLFLIF